MQQLVKEQPQSIESEINARHLATRILVCNAYEQVHGDAFTFDPWATSEEREKQLKAWLAR